jgi:ribosomal protein S18 acetylase RimI-like enzyme
MTKIEIKKVNVADLLELQVISRQTFIETFADQNTMEDIQKYIETNLSEDKLKSELYDTNSEFYFTISDNKVLGYLKINFGQAQTELKNKSTLEIERIYVLKAFHGKNIGQILFDKAINIAKQKKLVTIWLGVWEKNEKAIKFYEKNGLKAFDKHIFKLGDDEQTDIMMRLNLNEKD